MHQQTELVLLCIARSRVAPISGEFGLEQKIRCQSVNSHYLYLAVHKIFTAVLRYVDLNDFSIVSVQKMLSQPR